MLIRSIGVDEWKRHSHSHPWIGQIGGEKRTIEHPVCPQCEKIALRHHGWTQNRIARCPACGWTGRATVMLNEYVENKMYR